MMPRLIRRKPRWERIKEALNPGDFMLWLSEELETRDWDSKQFATPIALVFHLILLIARVQSGGNASRDRDDVFAEIQSGPGWWSYLVSQGTPPDDTNELTVE